MFRKLIVILTISATIPGYGQESLSYADQLKQLEEELDSLSIFNLLDSILLLDTSPTSEFNVRLGYTSSVTSAGRDYNINQSGSIQGLSFYHKSGLYADLSGYWNSGVTPSYNPIVISGGYLGSFSRKLSYSLDYEHWFYHKDDSSQNDLTNSIGTRSGNQWYGKVDCRTSYWWGG